MSLADLSKPRRLTAEEKRQQRRRGGWRTAAKRSRHGGPTWAGEKAAAKRLERQVKAATSAIVWRRSAVCEYCGDSERETAGKHWKARHEQDEVRPRSLTRGLPPEIRFAPENTARACALCHQKKTHGLIRPVYHDAAIGMKGSYDVVTAEGEVLRTVRR